MATSADNTATLSTMLYSYIDAKLLERLESKLELEQFAEKRDIPLNMGKTIQWKKFTNFAATTALADEGESGTTPQNLSATSVSATVETFGAFVKVADMLELTAITPFLDGAIDALSYQAKLTIDTRIRNGLYNTSSIPTGASGGFPLRYPATIGNLSTVAATHNPTLSTIKDVVFALRKQDAEPYEDGYYVAVLHPEQVNELMDDSTWATWNAPQHASETMWKGEIGRAHGCRIIASTNIFYTLSGTGGAAVSAYFGLVFGKSAYAVSRLGGKGMMETKIKRPTASSTNDPLDMFSTLGWKSRFATHVLDTSRGFVLVTGD